MEEEIINFHYELEDFVLSPESKFREWVKNLCREYKLEPECINYIFADDQYVLEINKKYLNHDYFTDIITFPISSEPLCVDIFISVERVRDNAAQFKISEDEELKRVMSHGVLHLAGYNDKTPEETQEMRAAEDRAIGLY